ncbi:hypothetical protein KI387_035254 [Taxus chinensis]|uniref:Uncharacterized protein n=1 Tax=Taxus chinensis TaxID=29808 RepID=A0AA38FQ35_TAXCH|nr:hypothetical protein KI387_035254 [Taxus chinensis]
MRSTQLDLHLGISRHTPKLRLDGYQRSESGFSLCGIDYLAEERGLTVQVEERVNDVIQLTEHLNDYVSSTYMEAENLLTAEPENETTIQASPPGLDFTVMLTEDESDCKENVFISQQNLEGEDSAQSLYQSVAKAKAKAEILEGENAELRATMKALKEQLSSYDSLILYPTYSKKLAAYPGSQQPMLELAMKANFYKSRHEIQQKIKEGTAVATGRSIDKSEEDSSQLQ